MQIRCRGPRSPDSNAFWVNQRGRDPKRTSSHNGSKRSGLRWPASWTHSLGSINHTFRSGLQMLLDLSSLGIFQTPFECRRRTLGRSTTECRRSHRRGSPHTLSYSHSRASLYDPFQAGTGYGILQFELPAMDAELLGMLGMTEEVSHHCAYASHCMR